MQYLFVYGTLAPNECNHHIMTPIAGSWQQAFVKAKMDKDGFGLTGGYPALVLDLPEQMTQTVQGWLFGSDELHLHWDRLDAFEGSAYQRECITVTTRAGERVDAYVYALHRKLYHKLDVARTNLADQ
ncbi:gamma-glutamylcyclotransferase family protein [Moraxella marmotae]|uniref:gamma-glutamylcyclotransferase family protein n=1 Tax=Moraxella marmotae TaxID=3344520 RepID=UPI0035F2A9BE